MRLYQLYVHVPEYIHQGLASGRFVRHAGVIRGGSTYSHPGGIVAHLRDAGTSIPAPSLGLPAFETAMLGTQMMTLGYLKVRFDRLEGYVKRMLPVVERTLQVVSEIQDVQYLEWARSVARGIELLSRCTIDSKPAWLEDARSRFVEGLADLRLLLIRHDGEALLGKYQLVEPLLEMAAFGAVGEVHALTLLDASVPARKQSLDAHAGLWRGIRERLEEVPPPTKRIPTRAMLETAKQRNPYELKRRWLEGSNAVLDTIDGEKGFLDAVAEAPNAKLVEWCEGAERHRGGTLCLVRREEDEPEAT